MFALRTPVSIGARRADKAVVRASWRDGGAATPAAARPSSGSKSAPVKRTQLPANWKQELEAMRNESTPAAAAPAARPSSGSWRDAPASSNGSSPAASGRPSSANKKVEIKRTVLPANWKEQLEGVRSESSSAAAPAARPSSGSWRDAPASSNGSSPAASGRPSSANKKVEIKRTVLPANWKEQLEGVRSESSSAAAPAARPSSGSWRDAPAAPSSSSASAGRPTSAGKRIEVKRTPLPSNWKQELEALRDSGSSSSAAAAPAARPASGSWRDAPASAPAAAPAAGGTNPWTGKAKSKIQKTVLPANWRDSL